MPSIAKRLITMSPVFAFVCWFALWRPADNLALPVVVIAIAASVVLWRYFTRQSVRAEALVLACLVVAGLMSSAPVDAAPSRSTVSMMRNMERTDAMEIVVGQRTKWTFDAHGHLIQMVTARGDVVRFVYDSPAAEFPSATSVDGSPFVANAVRGGDPVVFVHTLVESVRQQIPSSKCDILNNNKSARAKDWCVNDWALLVDVEAQANNMWASAPSSASGVDPAQCREICSDIYTWSMIMCTAVGIIDPPVGLVCAGAETTIYMTCKSRC